MCSRRSYDDTVRVIVGLKDKREGFTIHSATACAKSTFFKAACSTRWMGEGKERLVRLPDQDAEAFEVFVHWIYSDNLDLSTMTVSPSVQRIAGRAPPSYLNFGKVWALANYLGAPELRNLVIDGIIEKFATSVARINVLSLKRIWKMTFAGSTIRRVLVDYTVNTRCYSGSDAQAKMQALPEEIVQEAARRWLLGISKQPVPAFQDRCKYHEHAEGEPRCT